MSINKILVFSNTEICHNTLNYFTEQICAGMEKRGIDTIRVASMPNTDGYIDAMRRSIADGFDAAFMFNAFGQQDTTVNDGENLYDFLGVPFFNYIVDHPTMHRENLSTDFRNYHLLCVDGNHTAFSRRCYPHLKSVSHLPLGGWCDLTNGGAPFEKRSFRQREMDVVFLANHTPLQFSEESIIRQPQTARELILDMIDVMSENRELEPENAFEMVWRSKHGGQEVPVEIFRENSEAIHEASWYMHCYSREEVARYIMASGVKAHFFGNGWDLIEEEDRGNAVIHGEIDYLETMNICSNARIVVNDNAGFHKTIHDRAETAMLNGAALLSCRNAYLEEVLNETGEAKDVFFYDGNQPESIIDVLTNAMDSPEAMESIALNGRKKAEKCFTWDTRVEELLRIMGGVS